MQRSIHFYAGSTVVDLQLDRKCNLLIRIKQKWDKRFNELKPDNSWSDKNRLTGWWLSIAEMLLYLNNVKKKEILQLYPGEWQKTISKWDFKSEPVEGLVDRFKTNFFSSLQHVSNPFDLQNCCFWLPDRCKTRLFCFKMY